MPSRYHTFAELSAALEKAEHRIEVLEKLIFQNNAWKPWQPNNIPPQTVYPVWQPQEYFVIHPDTNKYYVGTPPQTYPAISAGCVLVADSEGGLHWEHCESLDLVLNHNSDNESIGLTD